MNVSQRRKARYFALQAIYQWQLSGGTTQEITTQFLNSANGKADVDYLQDLIKGVIENATAIDENISPVLDRAIHEINPVELAALRVATFELMNRFDIPYRVIINEALELTKTFGADEAFKYVNGVLDKIAHKLRGVEIAAKRVEAVKAPK